MKTLNDKRLGIAVKENENKNLKAQLKEAKEYLKSDFRF